ncbi:pre T-cell antigen receptor alpha [Sceloporus undulatus]|uniref:pre T-cell antigen receptor alpha n=1 Tax=Sceloporus undulatus TaxID=8520 RepID=UPI001C4B5058|nr:pre T-cell antigen receptor alpha [Sceloporus undulatus]XP_042326117.1 pre T-cell antigen receptor alpha [Sceloporus undulatus]XP_042326124.1 pre T-cell antigen receptor alpha [Sceloporus undulatus]
MSQQEPPRHKIQLTWRPLGHLLTSMAFQLLTCGCSSGLIPTLSPPKNVIINGEKKTLVACLVKDLSEDALGAVWFSNGNGSMLPSSIYGISREEDGTFSAVSQISVSTQDFESWDAIVCYVAQNQTSQIWNTTSLQTSERNMGELCLDENQEALDQALLLGVLHNRTQVVLLLTIRVLLFKIILFDVLMSCCILYKK